MKFIYTLLLSFLVTFNAYALILNGVNYKQYTGTGTQCPDGSATVVYNNNKYCKAYTAKITWAPPTTRANGTSLLISELKGYEIYWTRTSDNAVGTIKIGSGKTSQYMWDVYTPGMYYFTMSAIDTKGVKSTLSRVIGVQLGN